MNNLSKMYYYVNNEDFLEPPTKSHLKVIWVGEDAYFDAINYKNKNGSFESPNEHIILYNRIDELNEQLFKKTTILNETYPLWVDDYNLETLVDITKTLLSNANDRKESRFVVIGNPAELLVQAFIKSICILENSSVEDTKFDFHHYFHKTSFILLNDVEVFKDFSLEINTSQKLIEQNFPRTHEVIESKDFDWMNYLKNEDTFVPLINKKTYKSRKN